MKERMVGWLVISLLILPTAAFGLAESKETKSGAGKDTGKTDAGKTVSATRNLQSFNAVSFSGVGNLHIKQSEQQGFTIEAGANILPLVIVYVKNKTLYIDLKDSSAHMKAKIDYYLNIKDLQKIETFSSSTIFIPDGFETNVLNLSLNSFGDANIKMNVKKFIAKIGGGSKMSARGSATEQEVEISGAGEFNGSKLSGNKSILNISGSGIAKTNVSDSLLVKVSGEGEVKYCGKPTIVRDISGKAIVSPLEGAECR